MDTLLVHRCWSQTDCGEFSLHHLHVTYCMYITVINTPISIGPITTHLGSNQIIFLRMFLVLHKSEKPTAQNEF